ncbi:response regulator transcription factor [Pseudomonas aeruginosa]|uniref:response regulator transcription factor n=1 Tax=Pseudomonas aeruginosa TaxID=287 RepID=UPI0029668E9D|nr:response regulator transcription factor [Pseudomonas aeruginosa]MDW3583713.1 response regulator transcription factor [Pseudomonas aeruginosa]
MSKVLIVDDHPAIRLAVCLLFERDGFTIVGEADNGAEALQVARKKSPDLAILDIGIPKIDGLEVIARLKSLKLDTKVLVLTRQNPAQFAPRCLQAGAMGFVSKRENLSELLLAAKAVLAGYIHFPTGALRSINQQSRDNEARMLESLSDREMTVLQYLANGNTNKAIAQQLFLSEKTVSTYKSRIMLKLNAHSLAGLIDFARRHELI